ncbi:MAG: PA14 domain-containing protein, partial [Thermoguttaceae bacterium]
MGYGQAMPATACCSSTTSSAPAAARSSPPIRSPAPRSRCTSPIWATSSNCIACCSPGTRATRIDANGVEAAAAYDATFHPTSSGIFVTIDVTSSLVAWQADPTKNFGWALLPTGSDGVRFSSRELATIADRPQLTVRVNATGTGAPGHFGINNQFPGQSGAVNNFVIEADYRLFIPSAGQYTFGVNSDDGFSLSLDNGIDPAYTCSYNGLRTGADTLQTFNFTRAGSYNLRLVYFQNTGDAGFELFAASGAWSSYSATNTWRLVGDIVGGGLNDEDQGTAWISPSFSDSSWNHGPSQLGYGDGDEATVTSYIDNDPNTSGVQKNATTYFRRSFEVTDPSQYNGLVLQLVRDDGAVVYLNGVEILRDNMPSGTITHTTWASVNTPDENAFRTFNIDPSYLEAGTNVMAVEVHQYSGVSSDVSFDMILEATRPSTSTTTGITLSPGINRVTVDTYDGPDGTGNKLKEGTIDIWCDPTPAPADPLPALADPPGLAANPHINLTVRDNYLPGVPILVRAELADDQQRVDRDIWNGFFTLSVDNPAITLSTTQVPFDNGLGSALVTVTGSGTFTLTATWTDSSRNLTRTATKTLTSLQGQSMTTLSGTLSGANLTWSGIIHVTADVTVPSGSTLTINPDTLVLLDGVARGGTTGADIQVLGSLQSLGTAAQPVTITAYNPTMYWGEIVFSNAAASLLQYTEITHAGSSPVIGHPGSGSVGPALYPQNTSLTLNYVSVTDVGGKIMYATGSDITATHNLWERAVMGPEITGTGLLLTNSFIEEMRWNDDADGIYLWDAGSKSITIRGGVIAGTDDDGIDHMASTILVDDMIIRDTHDKGISQYDGTVTVTRSLFVDNSRQPEDGSQAAISVKTTAGTTATTNIDHCTIYNDNPIGIGIQSRNKYGVASGRIIYNVTNSIIEAYQVVAVDTPVYSPDDVHISYSDLIGTVGVPWTNGGSHDNLVNQDPRWVNVAGSDYGNPTASVSRDFRLQNTSPCIDAGDPAALVDADSTRADVGARSYDATAGYATRTIAAGHITADTLMYPAASPYHITGAVIVDAGATLFILAGTTVFFDAGASLTIDGGLVAVGTASQQIRFTSTPGAGTWNGIQFVNTMANNRISYAILEYAATDNGMIGLVSSNLTVDHCTLDHTSDRRRISTLNSSLVVR